MYLLLPARLTSTAALVFFGCKNTQLDILHIQRSACNQNNSHWQWIMKNKYSPSVQLQCCQQRCSTNQYEIHFTEWLTYLPACHHQCKRQQTHKMWPQMQEHNSMCLYIDDHQTIPSTESSRWHLFLLVCHYKCASYMYFFTCRLKTSVMKACFC